MDLVYKGSDGKEMMFTLGHGEDMVAFEVEVGDTFVETMNTLAEVVSKQYKEFIKHEN